MSIQRDDRLYYGTVSKSRRGTPVAEPGGSFFLQESQGGRTVLPPISALPNSHFPVPSSYSNQHTQPRSSPRYDYTGAVYNQWPVGTNPGLSFSFQIPFN
ncbi:hypothetical protein C8J56DRAFT_925757 [Mycena floridula]|nr:hypothetical protein C8J56DRAFT_925757 [Mycena floridula]